MLLEITTPPAPASPCNRRKMMKVWMLLEYRHPKVDRQKTTSEAINGFFLPYLSLNGPISNCPTAKPIILNVRLNCTLDAVVQKYAISEGNDGK